MAGNPVEIDQTIGVQNSAYRGTAFSFYLFRRMKAKVSRYIDSFAFFLLDSIEYSKLNIQHKDELKRS